MIDFPKCTLFKIKVLKRMVDYKVVLNILTGMLIKKMDIKTKDLQL